MFPRLQIFRFGNIAAPHKNGYVTKVPLNTYTCTYLESRIDKKKKKKRGFYYCEQYNYIAFIRKPVENIAKTVENVPSRV